MAGNTVTSNLVIRINGTEVANTFNSLAGVVKKLEGELRKLTPGTEEFEKKASELREARAHFNRVREEISQVNQQLDRTAREAGAAGDALREAGRGALGFWGQVKAVVAGNVFTNFFSGFVNRAKGSVEELLKISDAMTGVEKTSGLASDKVKELWDDFDALDTRTSKLDLMNIAQIGGRLGITDKEELRSFTEEIDKIYVALGDSFQGGLEAVTTKVGKLKNLFDETKEEDYGESLNAIGSALNELGANGTASEENITDFATRIGQLPSALKPTISQTLGLGAAFEEAGIDAEVASSGYSRFMSVAGQNVGAFAKQMQMSTAEAQELFNTKPEEFFLKFGQSIKGLNAEDTAGVLKGLKLNTLEVQKALGAAGDNADRFRELMDLSGDAMLEGISIQEEFNKVNNNTAAIWEKIKKVWSETFTSSTIAGFFSWFIKALGWLTGVTSEAGDGVKVFRERLVFLGKTVLVCATAVVSYKGAMYLSMITTKRALEQTLLYNAVVKIQEAWTRTATGATLLWSAAKAALTLNFTKARAALVAFNLATKASPLGLLIGVISAATAAYKLFSREVSESVRQQRLHQQIQKEVADSVASEKREVFSLIKIIKDETKSRNEKEIAMKRLQEIAPEYFRTLDIDKLKTDEGRKAIDAYVKSLKRKKEMELLVAKSNENDEKIREVTEQGPLAQNSNWNPANWFRDNEDYARTYDEQVAKEKAYLQDLLDKRRISQRGYEEALKRRLGIIGSIYENQNEELRRRKKDKEYYDKRLQELAEEDVAEQASKNGRDNIPPLSSGGEASTHKTKKTKSEKDYKSAYDRAKKARLEAEQELQKELTQGLEESLDKQLSTTEQKYNEKKFKLQQENETLRAEIAQLSVPELGGEESAAQRALREQALSEKRKLLELNAQIEVAIEGQKQAELEKVREKYFLKEAEKRAKEQGNAIDALKGEKREEIIAIESLEEAKRALKGTLSERALADIKTLEQAKKQLREQADKEVLEASLRVYEGQRAILKSYLGTLTGEAREQLAQDIEKVEEKLLEVQEKLDEIKNKDASKKEQEKGKELEKVDVLGFTAKDWDDTFSHLDKMEQQFKAVDMVVGAMGNAFNMFTQLQSNLNQKELSSYTKAQEGKKKALLSQLNQGYISQAQYQKELQKLEEESQGKKKELELKQFKAQKAMNMMQIVANTATGIMRAYSDAGPIAGSVFAAIVGSLGAVQLGIVASQQPPSYAKGGYTQGVGYRDDSGEEVAGVVHGGEYVVPRWLMKEPEVADVVGWIEERRRRGASRMGNYEGDKGYEVQAAPAEERNELQARTSEGQVASAGDFKGAVERLVSMLERIEREGIEAYMVSDVRNGKEIRQAIKKYEAMIANEGMR